jgi:hypothetical protein
MKKILSTIVLATALIAPKVANAQLVPCGGKDNPCQLCHLFVLLNNILHFIFVDFVPPIAIIALIIGGGYLLISAGDQAKFAKAKEIFKAVVIGMVIIYGAWIIVSSIFVGIGVMEWTGLENWFEYPCN